MVKRIGRQHILIVDAERDGVSTYLFFRQLDGQHLVVGEGHLLHHNHVAIAILEGLRIVLHKRWGQFHYLRIGSLALLLVR